MEDDSLVVYFGSPLGYRLLMYLLRGCDINVLNMSDPNARSKLTLPKLIVIEAPTRPAAVAEIQQIQAKANLPNLTTTPVLVLLSGDDKSEIDMLEGQFAAVTVVELLHSEWHLLPTIILANGTGEAVS